MAESSTVLRSLFHLCMLSGVPVLFGTEAGDDDGSDLLFSSAFPTINVWRLQTVLQFSCDLSALSHGLTVRYKSTERVIPVLYFLRTFAVSPGQYRWRDEVLSVIPLQLEPPPIRNILLLKIGKGKFLLVPGFNLVTI